MDADADADENEDYPIIDLAELLLTRPPVVVVRLSNALAPLSPKAPAIAKLTRRIIFPELDIHCDNEKCGGARVHNCVEGMANAIGSNPDRRILVYQCRNCGQIGKYYALLLNLLPEAEELLAAKIGECPPFGPPIPTRVNSLIGTDRELFLKGRRAENQGLGLGAFAYYRRVVEDQWHRLIDEILRAADETNASSSIIEVLTKARGEKRFSAAVDMIKDGIPEFIKVGGRNPLTMLHDALSVGVHGMTDDECLSIAQDVRVILFTLAEQIGQALAGKREIREAVNRLTLRASKTKKASK